MSRITVMLLTWAPYVEHPRHRYAMQTLEAALANLNFDGELRWHIADDGSDRLHVSLLEGLCRQRGIEPTFSNAERGGYGHSYNLACQVVQDRSDFVLVLEDDWQLTRTLDLTPLARVLEADGPVQCIRLGYLGFTQRLAGEVVIQEQQTFLLLDPASNEPHVFAGHARLETVGFEQRVGAWPEGLAAGATEFVISHRPESRVGVAWPLDLGLYANPVYGALFAHIGGESVGEIEPAAAS